MTSGLLADAGDFLHLSETLNALQIKPRSESRYTVGRFNFNTSDEYELA